MTKTLRRATSTRQAKRIRRQSGRADGLSPTLADEISAGMELLKDNRNADGAAGDIGVCRTVYYELIAHPLEMTLGEFLHLLVKSEARNPGFGSRVIGHLSALSVQAALAASEARHTYERIQTGQRALFGEKR